MKQGHAMMKQINWEETNNEIVASFKVSKQNASKLRQLAETGRFVMECGGIESPYAIQKVEGQIATFVVVLDGLEFDGKGFKSPQDQKEEHAFGVMAWDMATIGAPIGGW